MGNKLKILFVIQLMGHCHYYKSIIGALCRRGHKVTVLFDKEFSQNAPREPLEALKSQFANFSSDWLIRRKDFWRKIIFPVREILNCRRHLIINSASHRNWRRYTPLWFRAFTKLPVGIWLVKTEIVSWLLRKVENLTPASQTIAKHIETFNPDVVIVGPANLQQAEELEYLKAAKSLRLPTVIPVLSWDNLTTKGLFHIVPDLLLAWNEAHFKQAQRHHNVPEEKICITGSSFFDPWFTNLKPSCSREEFCARHGLRAANPILLHLGSSRNMTDDETMVTKALRVALDGSDDGRLRRTQIIVRPHGANFRIFEDLDLRDTIVLPKSGGSPITPEALQLFYDTLYYAAAVVEINTSAMIDSIIFNKQGIILLLPKYAATQVGLEYFHDLLENKTSEIARNYREFVEIFKQILDGKDNRKMQREAFVAKFIRPFGLNVSGGERVAEATEELVAA